MSAGRIPVTDTNLTQGECEVVLRALGSYQIHLFDEMKKGEGEKSVLAGQLKQESDLVTSAIKKIHRVLEGQGKK
jgi:hypothetical protein